MSMRTNPGRVVIIRSEEQIDVKMNHLKNLIREAAFYPAELELRKYVEARSLPQNRLFWEWMTEIAIAFSIGAIEYKSSEIHDLVCHKFLGYYERVVESETIRQLRTTTHPKKLDKGEFHLFLERIDACGGAWGQADLPRPF